MLDIYSANPANAGGILGIWLNGAIRISAAVSATRSKCACVSFMLWCICLDNTIGFTSAQEQEENSGLAHKASLFYYCPFFPHNPLLSPTYFIHLFLSTICHTYFSACCIPFSVSFSQVPCFFFSLAEQLCPKLTSPRWSGWNWFAIMWVQVPRTRTVFYLPRAHVDILWNAYVSRHIVFLYEVTSATTDLAYNATF